ncbi:MAG: N,N-dimethylformamidase beta subunit family domain-containing protein [Actinomycetota bacterium]
MATIIAFCISGSGRHAHSGLTPLLLPPVRLIRVATHFRPRSDPPVARENRHPGTTTWHLDSSLPGEIAGYASSTSVTPGQPVTVMVRTSAPRFRAEIFRLGWYQGKGGRLVGSIEGITGSGQSRCPTTGRTLTTACSWRPSFVVDTRAGWVSGVYLIKLIGAPYDESYVLFTLRELKPRAPILFQDSVTTWEAYNRWGGRDLYYGPCAKGQCHVSRARAVSFDRPYEWPGAPRDFFGLEYPLLSFLESKGYDLAYATDIDLHESHNDIGRRALFLSVGHDEYYSPAMRTALESALDGGTSIAFFGANDIFRRIRFAPSPLGRDRIEVNYRSVSEDPVARAHPGLTTTNWPSQPNRRPEQALIGNQYDCANVHGDWVAAGRPSWLFDGTGLMRGEAVRDLFEREVDHVDPRFPLPKGVVVVASGSVDCAATAGRIAETTYYTAPSGAGVFDAGSLQFDCALGPHPFGCSGFGPVLGEVPALRRLVENLIGYLVRRAR